MRLSSTHQVMHRLILTRQESSDQGTFGILQFEHDGWLESFFTGELPWRDNKSDISCIPTGIYTCVWNHSPRLNRMVYLVNGVKDRTGIRVHSANLMGDDTRGYKRQLNGCIALGERLGWIEGQRAVLLSYPAVRRFETLMAGKTFELEIRIK